MANSDQMLRKKVIYRLCVIVAAFAATIIIAGVSLMPGTLAFTLTDVLNVLKGCSGNDLAKQIIINVRMPRILTGLLVGMNLSVAGVLLQGILRNPMAAPNIIGVNAGAGFGAVMIMIFMPGKISLIPVMAFMGALLAAAFIYSLAMHCSGKYATVFIILAGVAVPSLLHAVTAALMFLNSAPYGQIADWRRSSVFSAIVGNFGRISTPFIRYCGGNFLSAGGVGGRHCHGGARRALFSANSI